MLLLFFLNAVSNVQQPSVLFVQEWILVKKCGLAVAEVVVVTIFRPDGLLPPDDVDVVDGGFIRRSLSSVAAEPSYVHVLG